MISVSAILLAGFFIVLVALAFWVAWWALDKLGLPEPFNKVLRALVVLAAAFFCIAVLMGLAGRPLITW